MRRSNRQPTGLIVMALLMISMLVIAGCGSKAGDASGADSTKHPLVTIEMESGKKMEVELYPDTAPNTVNNFISLVNKGFYDGLIFHRVIPGFMIQGGDPQGTGVGGPGYCIKGEFSANGVTNDLKHAEGVISMARSTDPDSAGSQFFIMDADAPHLDGQYAAFGKVTSGIEMVHEIANVKRDANDRPAEDQKIKKITVDTFGVEYKEPETIKEPDSK
ncbi:peptidylprolyl isomerase [Paenibacillus popilliae]|uniref:Peptidyl-prolyl cis-trans isomerase n=1 Tax=Paenibacillus popilliae ATCC 14706 TaxID=1212764 RepID=M9M2R6_PAEPP|nr:peptidylprolyl isomerase [Paenibacillus popilliae]GAC43264.1 peptidyl-prolyl cis-trans isomerase [Paenibacillus popilliae ATCC 14706]